MSIVRILQVFELAHYSLARGRSYVSNDDAAIKIQTAIRGFVAQTLQRTLKSVIVLHKNIGVTVDTLLKQGRNLLQ